MHLVGCLYNLYQWCAVRQISDNEIYLLIKYIKSVLWRVAKCLSYIEEARCLKINGKHSFEQTCMSRQLSYNGHSHLFPICLIIICEKIKYEKNLESIIYSVQWLGQELHFLGLIFGRTKRSALSKTSRSIWCLYDRASLIQ